LDLRTGKIIPETPFSFEQCLSYIQSFPASQNDHKIDAGQLIKAFRIGDKTYAMQIFNRGEVDDPKLRVTIMSTNPMKDRELEQALQKVRFYLGIDDPIQEFYEIGDRDSMFKPLINSLYGHHMIKFLSIFEAAIWKLLSSNLTLAESIKSKKMLQQRLGAMININGINYRAFPEPLDVLEAPDEELAYALPQERIQKRVHQMASFFSDYHSMSALQNMSNDEIKDELLQLEGIDQGGSIYILNYGLGRMDEIHYGDPLLVQSVEKTYGTHHEINREKIKELASQYGKWKGYWAHYLRQSHAKNH